MARFDPAAVLQEVLRDLRPVLEPTGGRVTQDLPPVVEGDQALFRQLLQNLVENAIKYGGDSPPLVNVSARGAGDEWVFSVEDNGIGIEPQHAERIFEMFRRLHADESRYSGLGIGLSTCKKIVEKHGGRIWVESRPGGGSRFSFTLPRREDGTRQGETGAQESSGSSVETDADPS